MKIFGHFLLFLVWLTPSFLLGESNYTWKSVQIGGGGFVSGIVFSRAEAGLIYCRTDIGGVYRWDESTQNWIPLMDMFGGDDWGAGAAGNNWSLHDIESLAADPTDPNRVYVAAGASIDWTWPQAILISNDKGNSWTRVTPPFRMAGNNEGRSNGERLAIDPNSPNLLYIGTRADGLYRSPDRAATWTKVESFPVAGSDNSAEIGIVFVHFFKNSAASGSPTLTIYVGVNQLGYAALYRSIDAGTTWAPVPGQPTTFTADNTKRVMPHRMAMSDNGLIYITYGDAPGPNGVSMGEVWKYNPNGNVWTNISPSTHEQAQGGFSGISIDAQNPNLLAVSTIDRWWPGDIVYRSIDGGQSWINLDTNATHTASTAPWVYWHRDPSQVGWGNWMGDFEIDPFDPNHALYGTGGGIWGTNNLGDADSGLPTQWTFRSKNLEESGCWGSNKSLISPPPIVSSPDAVGLLYSAQGDIDGFRWDNLDQSPPAGQHNPPHGSNTSIAYAPGNSLLMVRTHWGVTRGSYSTDAGKSWTDFPSCPVAVSSASEPGTIALSADGAVIVWTARGTQPYFSTDWGTSWTASSGVPTPPNDWTRYGATADSINASVFYLYDPNTGNVYKSSDQGRTFSVSYSGLPTFGDSMNAPFGRAGDVWAPTGSGLYHSSDAGVSFSKVNGFSWSRCVGFGRAAPGQNYPAVFAYGQIGGIYGVYRSDDVGSTWIRINDEQHRWPWIADVIGDPRTYGRCYVTPVGRGVLYGDLNSANPSVPTIITQPIGDLIARGRSFRLSVEAIGKAPLKYQWFQQPTGGPARLIPLATSSLYTTPALQRTTTYWVMVSNSAGLVTSQKANVVVADPAAPSILSQSQDQTADVGQTASFSVVATGLPKNLTYQWQVLKQGSGTWVNLNDDTLYSGTHSPTLSIANVTISMSGDSFAVLIANGVAPDLLSTPARLTVNLGQPPIVIVQPTSGYAAYNWPTTLTVTAGGSAPFVYQWYEGNSGDLSRPLANKTDATLTTENLTTDTSFWVSVTNSAGTIYSTTALIHVLAPSPVADGTYKLINRKSGLVLEVVNNQLTNDGYIALATSVGTSNQQWTLTDLGGGERKVLGLASGLSADVSGWSTSNGSRIDMWSFGGGANQRWTFSDLGNGYFAIVAGNSGKAMSIADQAIQPGAALVQWTFEGREDQQWQLVPQP